MSRLLAEREVWMHLYHIGGEGYSVEEFKAQYGAEISHIKEKMIPWPKTNNLPGHYIRENKKYSQLIYNDVKDNINEFDLIYAQGFTGWYFIWQRQKGRLHVPVLVNFHGYEMFQKAPSKKVALEYKLFRKAVKYNVLHADYVYSFGGQIDNILKDLRVGKERILVQSNGIEESWIVNRSSNEIRNQKRTITFIGRNERRKGIEELNEALDILLKRKGLTFKFNFIGPIPEAAQLKDERIEYFGEIRDSDQIKEILQQSDGLICPSHSEGMPTVILEAMASGLAIVATDVGAVSRMIDGNGILMKEPDPDLIKNAILEMIEMSVEDLNKMKDRSIELIQENFIWEVIADLKIAQFNRILHL